MARPEKVQAVADIKERIERARAVFLAEYAGLSVKDQQTLRRSLRAGGAEFKVVKMTLARRAVAELDLEGVEDLLLGPTGLAFADGDPVSAAKALKDFARDHEVFTVKGGVLGSDFLTPERISELAEIEPRDVLLAKIAGAMQAPIANMAGLIAAMPRNFATMLQQLLEKKQADAPEAETAPEPPDAPTEAEAASDDEADADDAATEAAVEETASADDAAGEAEVDAEAADEAEPEASTDEASEDTEPDSGDAEDASATDDDDTTEDDEAADEAEEE